MDSRIIARWEVFCWVGRAGLKAMFSRDIAIKFLGVWDTVGALGIPLNLLGQVNAKFYEFHDTGLSKIVENAYHAVAIDEHRSAGKRDIERLVRRRDDIRPPRDGETMVVYELTPDDNNPLKRMQ